MVPSFFPSNNIYFLWSACPSLVRACVSQRRTASLDPRLLSAHSLGGPKGVKDMRLPIPTDHGLSWMIHGSLNDPIEHHPTIRYMVYNGYYKVMSNIPKMGHLTTPVIPSYKWPTHGGWKPPFKDWILVGLNLNDWQLKVFVNCVSNEKREKTGFSCNYFFFISIKLSHMLIVLMNYTISSTSRFVVVLSHLISSFTVIGATCVRSCT